MSTLTPIVGADRIRATVNVEYETGSSEESQERYDPAISAKLSMQHSEENSGSGVTAGGVPGTSSNVPSAKTAVATAASRDLGQSSKTDNETYGVNRTTRHVIDPAGSIRRITAAVLLDDAIQRKKENGKWVETRHKRQPEELKLIGELAQAAIGFNSERGDVISIQNLPFDHEEAADLQPLTVVDQARKGLNDFSSIIRYAVLICLFALVYLLAIKPIQKRVLATPVPAQAATLAPAQNEAALPLPSTSPVNLARSLVVKRQLAEYVRAEPESSTTAVRAWLREEVHGTAD
jgi:flagellar M-ring protein FliF